MRGAWAPSNMDDNGWVFSTTGGRHQDRDSRNGMTCSLSIVSQLIKQAPTRVLLGATHREYKGTALPASEKFKVKHLEERGQIIIV